ncbi:integrase core domain protein [Corynebacterium efficiens YS-314]|uniref:Putative transposase n=1 Tax=Corynebacterium efficiens (strain DSM 44549 / YS-314 / AJ 12310 / JCM 11189 / NBRC 100395) TaxID=196164 RepID=Q8FP43_COREF|nr:integrase core domain protein [Corynebacterium efficiens YS-314]BAC18756.1 putative transposase [Corynebacterium efficiens YS-314]
MIRFQFVEDHHHAHRVKRMCQLLGLQRSSFYKWRASRAARQRREGADAQLVARMREVHVERDRTYGYRRMTAELACDPRVVGPVNHKRVARLMRDHNLVGVHLRKPFRTTVGDPAAQVFPDLLERDFTASEPGARFVGDITYLPYGTEGKNLYLATVIDVCSKRIVGWSIADHMRTSLVEDALHHAFNNRGDISRSIMHTDHGRQYTSSAFQATCRQLGVIQSMGRIGSSADNALAEALNATLKRETLQGAKRWSSASACRQDVFRWIVRYNTSRRHSALAYRSPLDYETACASTLDLAA